MLTNLTITSSNDVNVMTRAPKIQLYFITRDQMAKTDIKFDLVFDCRSIPDCSSWQGPFPYSHARAMELRRRGRTVTEADELEIENNHRIDKLENVYVNQPEFTKIFRDVKEEIYQCVKYKRFGILCDLRQVYPKKGQPSNHRRTHFMQELRQRTRRDRKSRSGD